MLGFLEAQFGVPPYGFEPGWLKWGARGGFQGSIFAWKELDGRRDADSCCRFARPCCTVAAMASATRTTATGTLALLAALLILLSAATHHAPARRDSLPDGAARHAVLVVFDTL